MAWQTDRRQHLPPDWEARRKRVLERDGYRCTAILSDGTRCTRPATDVHHTGDRHDHREEMLASACEWHHRRETSAQGNAARSRMTQKRPPERHPGLT
jgi:5-methylcytosine-specific restriction enzyme A